MPERNSLARELSRVEQCSGAARRPFCKLKPEPVSQQHKQNTRTWSYLSVMAQDVSQFIQQVRRRPEIWMTDSEGHKDTKRVALAWKQVCRLTWPQFDTWSNDQKRTKCLALQKQWKNLQEEFLRETCGQKRRGGIPPTHKAPHHDLSFLIADIGTDRNEEVEGRRPAKRARRESSGDSLELVSPTEAAASVSSLKDNEEDRHFLLSLLSYMSDVPRASKLALREDMLKLIRRYTSGPGTKNSHC